MDQNKGRDRYSTRTKGRRPQKNSSSNPRQRVAVPAIRAQAKEAGVDGRILRRLLEMGFTELTPIQKQTIPLLLRGKDIVGQAQAGTGKTAAFGIPLLQQTDSQCRDVQALVLCPTRELAIQTADELRKFAKYMHGIKVLPVYGGQDINRQMRALKNVQIIVGTPGRIMDHMRRHTLKLHTLRMLVLDEADEMLNMGFQEDVEQILKDVPRDRQTALFSATMPGPIMELTHTYQKEDAEYVRVTSKELTVSPIEQYYFLINREDKLAAAERLLQLTECPGQQDIKALLPLIDRKLNETQITARELAAALLCQQITGGTATVTEEKATKEKMGKETLRRRERKLITGENRDPGYDTDYFSYRRGAMMPSHTLAIKTRDDNKKQLKSFERRNRKVPGKAGRTGSRTRNRREKYGN